MEVAAVLTAFQPNTALQGPLHALNVPPPIIAPVLQLSPNALTTHFAQQSQHLLPHAEIITNALVPLKRHAQREPIAPVLTQLILASHAQQVQNAQIKEAQDFSNVPMENGVLQDLKAAKLVVKANNALIKRSRQ